MTKLTSKYLRADDVDNLHEALLFADEQGYPLNLAITIKWSLRCSMADCVANGVWLMHRNVSVIPYTGVVTTCVGSGCVKLAMVPTIICSPASMRAFAFR